MAPKKKASAFEPEGGVIHGWSWRLQGDGQVKVGTHPKGHEFERWNFRLTSYDDGSDVRACIREEIRIRKKGRGPIPRDEYPNDGSRSRSRSRSRSCSYSRSQGQSRGCRQGRDAVYPIKLAVQNIPMTMTERDVRRVFEPFGVVHEVIIMRVASSAWVSACTVTYSSIPATIGAIRTLHNVAVLPGCSHRLSVTLAIGWDHLNLYQLMQQGHTVLPPRVAPARFVD